MNCPSATQSAKIHHGNNSKSNWTNNIRVKLGSNSFHQVLKKSLAELQNHWLSLQIHQQVSLRLKKSIPATEILQEQMKQSIFNWEEIDNQEAKS